MKKIKNKFIIWVILLLLFVASYETYKYYNLYKIDTNSYAILIEWEWYLNDNSLYEDEKRVLSVWDKIKTVWESSIVVLEWWDWSITRLWWDSSVLINEDFISKDLTKIKISFNLLKWKSWSNVINYMWEDSYFTEYFNDIEAAVRGTVFDVDLTKEYLYVTDHEVSLKTKSGKMFNIWENAPFSIKTFWFLNLKEFLENTRDRAWEELNSKFDKDLLNKLKISLLKSFNESNPLNIFNKIKWNLDIGSLNAEDKKELYNSLLSEYQSLNFINNKDKDLFKTKLEVKEFLIELAPKEEKEKLLKTVVYDFKDILNSGEYNSLEDILWILKNNSSYLRKLNFEDYFSKENISSELEQILNKNLWALKAIFGDDFEIKKIGAKDILDSAEKAIHNSLDTTLEGFKKLFNK